MKKSYLFLCIIISFSSKYLNGITFLDNHKKTKFNYCQLGLVINNIKLDDIYIDKFMGNGHAPKSSDSLIKIDTSNLNVQDLLLNFRKVGNTYICQNYSNQSAFEVDGEAIKLINYSNIEDAIMFNMCLLDEENKVDDFKAKAKGNVLEIKNNNIQYLYTSGVKGLKQDIIISSPINKSEVLECIYKFSSDVTINKRDADFEVIKNDSFSAVFKDFYIYDANNKRLDFKLDYANNSKSIIVLKINVLGAKYPIKIDPIIVRNSFFGGQFTAQFGKSCGSAGDVNGDGYSDVVVGAPGFRPLGAAKAAGACFVFYGSSNGLSPANFDIIPYPSGNCESFGIAVHTAGDINGDGISDLAIGDPGYASVGVNEGAFFVFYGSAMGIIPTPVFSFASGTPYQYLGQSIGGGGDIDNDGFSDLIIGGSGVFGAFPGPPWGVAELFWGDVTGLSATNRITFLPSSINDGFAFDVGIAGDINGDNFTDFFISTRQFVASGQPMAGKVDVYFGKASKVATLYSLPDQTIFGSSTNAFIGDEVAALGDVNGDGYCDIATVRFIASTSNSFVDIYFGTATGLNLTPGYIYANPWGTTSHFGRFISGIGDVNGDGYSDILIGSPRISSFTGKINIYLGGIQLSSIPYFTYTPGQAGAFGGYLTFEKPYAAAGDFDGDGYSEFILGAGNYSNNFANEGAIFTFSGKPDLPSAPANPNYVDVHPYFSSEGTDIKCTYAGDLNGDGLSDFVVVHEFDYECPYDTLFCVYYGNSTMPIQKDWDAKKYTTCDGSLIFDTLYKTPYHLGDLNGDGYSDVGFSAMSQKGCGYSVFFCIHYGSAVGIGKDPVMIIQDDIQDVTTGDFNADGYADIVFFSTQTNSVNLIYGSSSGLNISSWQVRYSSSSLIKSIGDFKLDGYTDLIIMDNNEIDFYYGQSGGININNIPDQVVYKSSFGNEEIEISPSSFFAMDYNGDGASDLVFVDRVTNISTTGGKMKLYLGSTSGFISTNYLLFIPNQPNFFSSNVKCVPIGDINADGYADIMILKPSISTFDMYGDVLFGGSTQFVFVQIGYPIFSYGYNAWKYIDVGGDINGDGYGDFVNIFYNNSSTALNLLFRCYLGNRNGGRTNFLRTRNQSFTDVYKPVAGSSNIGLELNYSSFLGRMNANMYWEINNVFTPFSDLGNGMSNNTAFNGFQVPSVSLGLTSVPFQHIESISTGAPTQKYRFRVRFEPRNAFTGQVYSPWRYLSPNAVGATGAYINPVPNKLNVAKSDEKFILNVFPNPASEFIQFNSDLGCNQYSICDLTGKIIEQKEINKQNQYLLNIKELKPGIYFLKVKTGEGVECLTKFIKS